MSESLLSRTARCQGPQNGPRGVFTSLTAPSDGDVGLEVIRSEQTDVLPGAAHTLCSKPLGREMTEGVQPVVPPPWEGEPLSDPASVELDDAGVGLHVSRKNVQKCSLPRAVFA